ncbi:unnamed protein product [Durusdinium trenchii]|uniref:Beta-ketoacyl-[acyl-carrier-protein] synthase III C-terminal domain-containing protein n=1 Tax=Durusdinium trenchii TaxID=1381693 RepID=A0ABP0PMI3_9DINO
MQMKIFKCPERVPEVAMDFETDRDLATPNLRGSTALFGRPVAGHRGKEVFRFATSRVPKTLSKLLERSGVAPEEVDWLLLHQANRRIMDSAAKRLGVPQEKIICNLDEYGNTSAASIPLALDEAIREGRVKKGDLLACCGFGAGLTWGGRRLLTAGRRKPTVCLEWG